MASPAGTSGTNSGSRNTTTTTTTTTTELYLDEKWKLSKKEGPFSSRNSTSQMLIRNQSSRNSKSQVILRNQSSRNQTTTTATTTTASRKCAFTRKCARLVKEQRARFYIMRRCVTMLICWRDNFSDSDS